MKTWAARAIDVVRGTTCLCDCCQSLVLKRLKEAGERPSRVTTFHGYRAIRRDDGLWFEGSNPITGSTSWTSDIVRRFRFFERDAAMVQLWNFRLGKHKVKLFIVHTKSTEGR